MAHFSELDNNNVVLQVIVVGNENVPDEKTGQDFIAQIGITGNWKQTSFNTYHGEHLLNGTPFRGNFGQIGYTYDAVRDAFLPPKPYPSFILNEETYDWEPPTPQPEPTETHNWRWNEDLVSWEAVARPTEE